MSIQIQIPKRWGWGDSMEVRHVASDYTGTVSFNGELYLGIDEYLRKLHEKGVKVYFLTADTHGTAKGALARLPCEVEIVETGADKPGRVKDFGLEHTVVFGNGFNDVPMFNAARLGIVTDAGEGVNGTLLSVAAAKGWPVTKSPLDAFGLLLNPKRLYATIRD